MKELNQAEVQVCIGALSVAEEPNDAVLAWSILQGEHKNLSAIVALARYNKSGVPPSVAKYLSGSRNYLVSYFSSTNMYFLDDELLATMCDQGEFTFAVDYTLMFDTNIASYINKAVRGEPLGSIQTRFIALIDDILHDDLNFDHLFYMVENIKNVLPQLNRQDLTKLDLWKSLDKGFRRNLVSLQIFQSIDCQEYRRTCNPKPRLSHREAVREAIHFSYDFYGSNVGRDHLLNFVLVQRMLLLQLIGMIRIQLSSKKSAKNKMLDFFQFIHDVVGAYFDREAIIAHKYFHDRSCVGSIEKIKIGGSKVRLLKRLDNIAWDMAAPRFMEKLISSPSEGRYFVPLFLTFDSDLRELLAHYPVKGVIFNKESGAFAPIPKINTSQYFLEHDCLDGLKRVYSEPMRSERLSRDKPTRKSIHQLIRREYRLLRRLI